VAGALCLLGTGAVAWAAGIYTVNAKLTAQTEVPSAKAPAGAKGAFSGTYKENASGAMLKWKLSFTGLSGAATAAHIHKGKPGASGPVVVPLCGPCKSGASGSAQVSKAVISALESGGAYVNVHTGKNPAGEIRGQIKVKG
jgi:hypothetical protein